VGIAVCYSGTDLSVGERLIAPIKKLGTVAMEQIAPMPYPAVQMMINEAAVPHRRYYMRSNFLDDVSDGAIDVCAESFANVPSPFSSIVIVSMGGAVSRVAPEATAYFHRGARFTMSVIGCWREREEDEANIAWVRRLWDGLGPHLPSGVYVNELYDEGAERVRSAYGTSTFQRLAALKRRYDPTNLFRLNQNIQPA
jgi:hypothetical protein